MLVNSARGHLASLSYRPVITRSRPTRVIHFSPRQSFARSTRFELSSGSKPLQRSETPDHAGH